MDSKRMRDPDAPKRNLSAYLLYQNAMRDSFKAMNPGMTFGQLSKFTSQMYAQITQEEKNAWENRAELDKQRFLQELALYRPPPGFDSRGDALPQQPMAMPMSMPMPMMHHRHGDNHFIHPPKKCLPAYMLFQNAMRDQFRRENPGMTFGELSTYTSQKYKELTPEQKAEWQALAIEDKNRYEQEKTMYYPPFNTVPYTPQVKRMRKNMRKTKAEGAPKRARGAYVFFTNDARPIIMEKNPGIDFKELGIAMGEQWRSLTPEQRAPYEAMATADKERFKQEMEEFQNVSSAAISLVTSSGRENAMASSIPPSADYMNGYASSVHAHEYEQSIRYADTSSIHPHEYYNPSVHVNEYARSSLNPHDYPSLHSHEYQSIHPEDDSHPFPLQSYGVNTYDNINPNNYYFDPYNYH